jgi:hypothetical protein
MCCVPLEWQVALPRHLHLRVEHSESVLNGHRNPDVVIGWISQLCTCIFLSRISTEAQKDETTTHISIIKAYIEHVCGCGPKLYSFLVILSL